MDLSASVERARALPRLFTLPEVAEGLALSRATIFKLMREGELPTVHVGRSLRFAQADIEEFIARARRAGPGSAVNGR